jgi:hypothetical protein
MMPTHIKSFFDTIMAAVEQRLDEFRPNLSQGTGTISIGGGGGGGGVSGTLPVANGGTGATTAPAARTNLGAAAQADLTAEIARAEAAEAAFAGSFLASYTTTVGDGSATSFVLTHGLGTSAISVIARLTASPYSEVSVQDEATTANTATIYASPAPSAGQLTITIQG